MRDNALAKALIGRGHEVQLLPMYLPLQLDEERMDAGMPVFFGGVNVFLQQKYGFFRKVPRWVDGLFNFRWMLRAVAQKSHLTSAKEQGEMTCLMLRMEESGLGKELNKLVEWLERDGVPEVVILSNALLSGLAAPLQERLGVKVVVTFQGEDGFLDGLPEPWAERAWKEMAKRVVGADGMIAPSRFFAGVMEERLGIEGIEVIANGIDLAGYEVGVGGGKTIGYLARMCHGKGLGLLIEAFCLLDDEEVELVVAGTMGGGDAEYVQGLKERLREAGREDRVRWAPDLSREEKCELLRSLSVFSVPALMSEAFGLYLVEAMACGVPVVMPRASSFVEIVEGCGCGILVEPESAQDLARGLSEVLRDEGWREMGKKGRLEVENRYDVEVMAESFEEFLGKVVEG